MTTDAGNAPAGTDGGNAASEPNAGQPSTDATGTPRPPEPNAVLEQAQAEAATWRGRYRELQGKFDTAVTDARKSADGTLTAMRERLVRAEVRAIAAGRLADPADAIKFVDESQFVKANGDLDNEAIGKAIDDLLASKPYLAKQATTSNGSPAGHGSADQGARGGSKPPPTTADAMNAIIRGAPAKH